MKNIILSILMLVGFFASAQTVCPEDTRVFPSGYDDHVSYEILNIDGTIYGLLRGSDILTVDPITPVITMYAGLKSDGDIDILVNGNVLSTIPGNAAFTALFARNDLTLLEEVNQNLFWQADASWEEVLYTTEVDDAWVTTGVSTSTQTENVRTRTSYTLRDGTPLGGYSSVTYRASQTPRGENFEYVEVRTTERRSRTTTITTQEWVINCDVDSDESEAREGNTRNQNANSGWSSIPSTVVRTNRVMAGTANPAPATPGQFDALRVANPTGRFSTILIAAVQDQYGQNYCSPGTRRTVYDLAAYGTNNSYETYRNSSGIDFVIIGVPSSSGVYSYALTRVWNGSCIFNVEGNFGGANALQSAKNAADAITS